MQAGVQAPAIVVEVQTTILTSGDPAKGVIRWSDETSPEETSLHLRRREDHREVWREKFLPSSAQKETSFTIDHSQLEGGYYQLLIKTGSEEERLVCHLTIPKQRLTGKAKQPEMSIREFLSSTMDIVTMKQSLPVKLDGQTFVFPVGERSINKGYHSIGALDTDGVPTLFAFPEVPWLWSPPWLDLALISNYPQLAKVLERDDLRETFDGFIVFFRQHGFEAKTGLGYLGEECFIDLRTLQPTNHSYFPTAKFKPFNYGIAPRIPEQAFWSELKPQMQRMMSSMFIGCVTDPATMDYNRFTLYGFDPESGKPVQEKNSSHCGFDSSAGEMIFWWIQAYIHSEDVRFLDWAERMFRKWEAVQHPETGLIPNFFGGIGDHPGADMPPGTWAESRGAAYTASRIASSARLLRRHQQEALADRMEQFSRRLALGILNFMYLPGERRFVENRNLDGSPLEGAVRYTFPTPQIKAAAVAKDARFKDVPVYDGLGLYRHPPYWSYCSGTAIPAELAAVALLSGDTTLTSKLEPLVADFRADRATTDGGITPDGTLRFKATAFHIAFLLAMHDATDRQEYLEEAFAIAHDEIAALNAMEAPEWWRVPGRTELIAVLGQLLERQK